MAPVTRFIILAAPRTGSNLLCTLLNSHPEVLCHHELFNPGGIYYALDYRDGTLDLGSLEARERDPFGFLRSVWMHTQGAGCVGFKITRGQNDAVMEALLGDPGVLKILLYRRNRLKTYVSEQLAIQTDRWEVYRRDELVTDTPRLRIDVGAFRAHCVLNEGFYRHIRHTLRSGRQRWIETVYENLLTGSEHVRLLEFLDAGTTGARLSQSSIKQNDTDLRTHIDNFQELELALAGSEYLAELYDCET
jgi:LPS sulfotransferase NodH